MEAVDAEWQLVDADDVVINDIKGARQFLQFDVEGEPAFGPVQDPRAT